MTKHYNRSLVTDEEEFFEKVSSRYFKSSKDIHDEENEVAVHLLCERKAQIDDGKPSHVGFCILAWSKLLFLRFVKFVNYSFYYIRFMYFIYEHFEEGSFQPVYADTDR